MSRIRVAVLAIAALVVAITMVGHLSETKACAAKGGKRLRGGLTEGFQCYELGTLRVLN